MGTELKQTFNRGNIKGVLSEKNLEYFKDDKGNIAGIRGSIIVDSAVGKHELRVYSGAKTKNGDPNKMYDNILALKNEYVAAIDATDDNPASYVSANFNLQTNDALNKQGEVATYLGMSLNTINRISESDANVEDDSTNMISLTVVYNKMTALPEKDRDNEGDKNLEVFAVNYKGEIMPFNLFVEEDIVDDVEELYSKGDTIEITIVPRQIHVAGREKKKAAFGKTANFSKGYDKLRLCLVGGDSIIDEDDENYIDPELVGKALQEREVKLKNLEKNGKSKSQNKAVAKASAKIKDSDIPF